MGPIHPVWALAAIHSRWGNRYQLNLAPIWSLTSNWAELGCSAQLVPSQLDSLDQQRDGVSGEKKTKSIKNSKILHNLKWKAKHKMSAKCF